MERNHVLHEGSQRIASRLVEFGASLIEEFQQAQGKVSINTGPRQIRDGRWYPPDPNLLKLNADASRYPRLSGVATVATIWDNLGMVYIS